MNSRVVPRILMLLLPFALCSGRVLAEVPKLILPDPGLQPEHLAVVINTRDPLSGKIAKYYRRRHHIPPQNLLRIAIDPNRPAMRPGEFAVVRREIEAKTPQRVQAYLLTWTQPYRVGCMSISSAFAFGFDRKYCAKGCKSTAVDAYANSNSLRPYDDFGIRPTMLLAARNLEEAEALIDRGVDATGWFFRGPVKKPVAYLVETPDKTRSVRKIYYPSVKREFGHRIAVRIEHTQGIEGAANILFYFTGARFVKGIYSNRYVPGAVADHLTSTGGRLTDSRQMSALEWLRAGATGSYGTVVEPCNILNKFPNPVRLIREYLSGRTLLDAYWKSVLTPGQGVFIGDPLAAPFRGYRLVRKKRRMLVQTAQLSPGIYRLLAGDSPRGPFQALTSGLKIGGGFQHFSLSPPYRPYYKLEPLETLEYYHLPLLPDSYEHLFSSP